jgi:hypothetical protein
MGLPVLFEHLVVDQCSHHSDIDAPADRGGDPLRDAGKMLHRSALPPRR